MSSDVTYTTIRAIRVPTALLAALDRDTSNGSRSKVISEALAARYAGNTPAGWTYQGRRARARGAQAKGFAVQDKLDFEG